MKQIGGNERNGKYRHKVKLNEAKYRTERNEADGIVVVVVQKKLTGKTCTYQTLLMV